MSAPVMWLLLFLAVVLALLVAVLTHTRFTPRKIAVIGMMTALSFVAYEFFRIPNVLGTGSSFHLGNTFTALTAMLLDGYAVTTFILKFIIGLACGWCAKNVFKLHELDPKTTPRGKYLLAVTGSAFSGLLLNVFTDPFLGYFRNRYIFGQTVELASIATKIASGVTLVNSVLSCICVVILYLALRPALERSKLL